MKLHLLDRSYLDNYSFNLTRRRFPHFLNLWHYHPELELVYILESTGTYFIGDGIGRFEPGTVVLIGKNIPHIWLNDEEYFCDRSDLLAESFSIYFEKDFWGDAFFQTPELKSIHQLFLRAQQSVHFLDLDQSILDAIGALYRQEPFERMMLFIRILRKLANHKEYVLISSPNFMITPSQAEPDKLDRVYDFVLRNFKQQIGAKDAALVACMHPSAFSRFFKRTHKISFTQYLNKVRTGHACKLLMENKLSIKEICYESGYSNVSNFNRQFKKIMNMSPSQYLHYHHKNDKVESQHSIHEPFRMRILERQQ